MTDNAFTEAERAAVYRAIGERRDMRHFSGGTVEPELLRRLLEAAHQAPSVGLMQPWRFIRISDRALRGQIRELVEQERIRTAEALGERTDEFMQLKVEGINDCAEVLVAALRMRRTVPLALLPLDSPSRQLVPAGHRTMMVEVWSRLANSAPTVPKSRSVDSVMRHELDTVAAAEV